MITATELHSLREEPSVENRITNAILSEHCTGGTSTCVYFKKEEFTDVDTDLYRLAMKFYLFGFHLDYEIVPESYIFKGSEIQVRISWA